MTDKAQAKYSESTTFGPWQQHVLLPGGTTVAVDDYDPKIHGRYLVEDEESYKRRLGAHPTGQVTAPNFPATTIAGLQTAEASDIHEAQRTRAPEPAAAPLAPAVAGTPVATKEQPDKGKDDKNATKPGDGKRTTR